MRQALQLHVARLRRPVVEEQDRRALADEVLLEAQHLAAVTERALREQAQLRQRVEDDAVRPDPLDVLEDRAGRLGQLDIGGVEDRVLRLEPALLLERRELEHRQPVERPAVGVGDLPDLELGLRQGDVERAFAGGDPGEQELQRERRLADTWIAFDEVDAVARQPAAKDVIEAVDSSSGQLRERCHLDILPGPAADAYCADLLAVSTAHTRGQPG